MREIRSRADSRYDGVNSSVFVVETIVVVFAATTKNVAAVEG